MENIRLYLNAQQAMVSLHSLERLLWYYLLYFSEVCLHWTWRKQERWWEISCFSICPQSIFHIPLCTVPSKNKQRLIKIGYAQDYTTSLHNLAFCKGEMFPWNIAAIVSVSQKPGGNNEKGNNKNLDKSLLHPHLPRLLLRVGAGLLGGQGRVREPQRLWWEPSLPQV